MKLKLHVGRFSLELQIDKKIVFALLTLALAPCIRPVALDEVLGVFSRIQPDDIWLERYQSHAAIKADMAA